MNNKQPTDSDLIGELFPAVDQYDQSVGRYYLWGYKPIPDSDDTHLVKLATLKFETAPLEVANARALMGMAMGMPQHNCPHCNMIIEAAVAPMDKMIADEERIFNERTQGRYQDGNKIVTGSEVVSDLKALRRSRTH